MIDPAQFKEVMRQHATTVVLISVRAAGRIQFMTATSFTPVSIDPPLALFCVHRKNSTHGLLEIGSDVGISLLSHKQEGMSRRFASKGPERYEIDDVTLAAGPAGTPLLADSCASMEVKLVAKHDGGDHSIFIGQICWATTARESSPLLYYEGQYLRIPPPDPARSISAMASGNAMNFLVGAGSR